MATALPLVNVTVRLVDQDGDPVIGAKVSAKLTTVERYQGYVIPQEYLGQTDDQGTCIVRLFPNELGTEGSEYRFKISYSTTPVSGGKSLQSCHIGGTGCYSSGGKTLTVYATIPNADCNLEDVCDLDPYPVRGSGQIITEQVLAASQQARTAAEEAEEAAAKIKVDIDAAKESAAQAKASADISTSKASIAEAGADRAELKADVADSRAKAAEAWAEKAKAWAESDTPPDPDDPGSMSAKTWAQSITIATPYKPGLVAPQVGNEDGLELGPDGTLRLKVAAQTVRGGVKASETPQAYTVPHSRADGTIDPNWVPGVLKRTGGQMDGEILFSTGHAIRRTVDTGALAISGGTVYDGTDATLFLHGKGNSNPGKAGLVEFLTGGTLFSFGANGIFVSNNRHVLMHDDIYMEVITNNGPVKYLPVGGTWIFMRVQFARENGAIIEASMHTEAGGSSVNISNENTQLIYAFRVSM